MPVPRVRALFAVVAALALTSCTATGAPGETEPPDSPPSARPTASAESSPANDEPASLVITPDGLGSLRLRAPYRDSPLVRFDDLYCQGTEGEIGRWTSADDPASFIPFPTLESMPDLLNALVIYSPTLETDAGMHVGSTLGEVQAAYPDLVGPVSDTGRSRSYQLEATDRLMIFEVLGPDSAGPIDTVSSITVTVVGDDALSGVYDGVDGPGGCG